MWPQHTLNSAIDSADLGREEQLGRLRREGDVAVQDDARTRHHLEAHGQGTGQTAGYYSAEFCCNYLVTVSEVIEYVRKSKTTTYTAQTYMITTHIYSRQNSVACNPCGDHLSHAFLFGRC